MKIIVDADACPVKDTVNHIAKQEDIPVFFVTNYSHFSPRSDCDSTIYVDKGADTADYKIVKIAEKGDIVITQDYGLASLSLGKGCYVLHHKGFAYTKYNIDQLLHTRYVSASMRKSGHRTKGPKKYTKEDEDKFRRLLIRTIRSQANSI